SPERTTTVSAIRTPHHGRARCQGKAAAAFSGKLGPNGALAVVGRSSGTDPTVTVRAAGLPAEATMSVVQERRDAGTERVPFSTLVEVCGSASTARAFEAQAVDVSARGMHLRTAYLPEEGDPLVCRFENGGEQIVVEGVVTWRRESGRGGEFGVKFTALDSRGVEALRKLTGLGGTDEAPEAPAPVGGRVRLHIDGLGSPMKARLKAAAATRLQVGSSLEFLKIGRKLEVEDLERGARRDAEIDAVSVLIDPSTRVPQLIVALRIDQDVTPSPSTSDVG